MSIILKVANGLNISNLTLWEKFYYLPKDKHYSYKINTDKGEYRILYLNTKNGKPYFLEYKKGYEDLGYSATAESLAKKAEKHFNNIGKYGF